MPGPWDLTPNRTLGMGAAIAQGLQQGFGAYQAQIEKNRAYDLKQQQMQGALELRKLQMMKLQQETAPIKNLWDKLQAMDSIEKGTGYQFSPKVKSGVEQQLVDSVRTPMQIQAAKQMADKLNAAPPEMGMGDVQAPSAKLLQSKNPNLGLMVGEGAPAQPQDQGGVQPVPNQMSEGAARAALQNVSPKEFQLLTNYRKAQNQTQLGFAGVQQRADAATMQHNAALAAIQQRMGQAKDANELNYWKTQYQDETKRFLGEAGNDTKVQVAQIGADSRQGVANTNAAARVKAAGMRKPGTASSPEQKAMLDIIKQKEKAVSDLQKPGNGINMELPSEKAARLQAAQQDLGRSYDQYKQKFGQDLRGGPAASAAPAKAPAATGGAPKVLSGDVATIKAQARAMPEGVPYSTPSGTWVNRGGVPQPYAPARAPQSVPPDSYPVEQGQ